MSKEKRQTIGVLADNSGVVVADSKHGLLVVEGFEIIKDGKTVNTIEATRKLARGERVNPLTSDDSTLSSAD